jgi:hypothetical protein
MLGTVLQAERLFGEDAAIGRFKRRTLLNTAAEISSCFVGRRLRLSSLFTPALIRRSLPLSRNDFEIGALSSTLLIKRKVPGLPHR